MKHRFDEDIKLNGKVNVEFDVEDVTQVVDKVTESVVTIIVVASVAHILRKWLA